MQRGHDGVVFRAAGRQNAGDAQPFAPKIQRVAGMQVVLLRETRARQRIVAAVGGPLPSTFQNLFTDLTPVVKLSFPNRSG